MPQHTYVDFDLLIERGDEGYRGRVLNSPVGETRPVPVTLPFSDLELENFLLRVGRPRRQTTRGEGTPEAAAVRDFGGRLFDAIFTDRVRTALTSSLDQVEGREDTGLRVRLRLADSPSSPTCPGSTSTTATPAGSWRSRRGRRWCATSSSRGGSAR